MILYYYFILHGKTTHRRRRRETFRPTDRLRRILLFTRTTAAYLRCRYSIIISSSTFVRILTRRRRIEYDVNRQISRYIIMLWIVWLYLQRATRGIRTTCVTVVCVYTSVLEHGYCYYTIFYYCYIVTLGQRS